MTTIEKKGRRHYLRGLPFGLKDRAKASGCKWDADERCWWTSKADVAAEIAGAAADASASDSGSRQREAPGDEAVVAGRVTYKGKTFYVAGRTVRGRTTYDDRVEGIVTRDGAKILLYFRDGSSSFWAARDAVEVVKRYDRPQTIGGLNRYAEKAKADKERYGYVPRKGVDYCGGRCPVDGHICTPDAPCHDCQ